MVGTYESYSSCAWAIPLTPIGSHSFSNARRIASWKRRARFLKSAVMVQPGWLQMAIHICPRPTSVQPDIAAVLEDLGPALRLAANKRIELGGRAAGGRENPNLLQFGDHGRVGVD